MDEPEMCKSSDGSQTQRPPTAGFCLQRTWKMQNDRDRKQQNGYRGWIWRQGLHFKGAKAICQDDGIILCFDFDGSPMTVYACQKSHTRH